MLCSERSCHNSGLLENMMVHLLEDLHCNIWDCSNICNRRYSRMMSAFGRGFQVKCDNWCYTIQCIGTTLHTTLGFAQLSPLLLQNWKFKWLDDLYVTWWGLHVFLLNLIVCVPGSLEIAKTGVNWHWKPPLCTPVTIVLLQHILNTLLFPHCMCSL